MGFYLQNYMFIINSIQCQLIFIIIISEVMIGMHGVANKIYPLISVTRAITHIQKWLVRSKKQKIQQIQGTQPQKNRWGEINEYIVYKDYLVPARPKNITRLQLYLLKQPQISNKRLNLLQIKYQMKSMDVKEIKKYKQKMLKYNQQVINPKQKQYDKIYKYINTLPFYYQMLLAKTQFNDTFKQEQLIQVQKQIQKLKQINTQQQEQQQQIYTQEFNQQQYTRILTDRQIYKKLTTIHPFIKYQLYNKCQYIHNKKSENKQFFNKVVFRVPYLYFQHPYELYIIDQFKKHSNSLNKQQFHTSIEQIKDFDNKFAQLDADTRAYYEDKAQKLIEEYENMLIKIANKSKLNLKRLNYLMKNQFQQKQYKILNKIR